MKHIVTVGEPLGCAVANRNLPKRLSSFGFVYSLGPDWTGLVRTRGVEAAS